MFSRGIMISSSLISGIQFELSKFGIPAIGVIGFIVAFTLGIYLFSNIINKKL